MTVFTIDVRDSGQQCELHVTGDVDCGVAEQLTSLGVRSCDDSAAGVLVIDLAGVTFLDSTGLGALIQIRNAGQERGKEVRLRNVPERVHRLLAITGLDGVFSAS